MNGFLSRNPELAAKKLVSVEDDHASAASPENLSVFFARLFALCEKYGVRGLSLVFNADQSGFSMKGMVYG